MNLILLGAPGAGKGTQAEAICKEFKIPAVSTGNLLREAVKNGDELGLKAKSYMDSGKLVPDEIVIAMLKERIAKDDCKNGFILDGFPRTILQAEALDKIGVNIDKVIEIDVPDEVILDRLSGRRVCEDCGTPYHITNKKPKVDGVCDVCNGKLVKRKDDNVDTIKDRLKVFHEQTAPLKDYYINQNKLSVVREHSTLEKAIEATLAAVRGNV